MQAVNKVSKINKVGEMDKGPWGKDVIVNQVDIEPNPKHEEQTTWEGH